MKKLNYLASALFCSILLLAGCQKSPISGEESTGNYEEKTAEEGGFKYEYVTGDPLKTRIYTLDNGLKVYLTVNKEKPRIQTYIAVAAGSKNDPAHATGLAHYLEHMVFKGTSKLGTADWAKEKVLLDSIEALFNQYRAIKDPAARKKHYQLIDKVSGEAARFAIANEYDKLMTHIGAQGTNAYTWVDQTVYTNDIPSNNLAKWAQIEAERFGELVPRLFHTELEAVYEEKNRGLDSDQNKVFEKLLEGLFPSHTYGTQTTIGTIGHLKNPSITEIKKFFDTYYVPNNMAVCLSGDLDPTETVKVIQQTLGKLKRKDLPTFTQPAQPELTVKKYDIYGPQQEQVLIGFRLPGRTSREALMAQMLSPILTNGQAGVMDLNLSAKQKVLFAAAGTEQMKEYSFFYLIGGPRQGQSLEEVGTLLLAQLDSVKQGRFSKTLLSSVISNLKVEKMRLLEENDSRANLLVNSFVNGDRYINDVKLVDELGKISEEDLRKFVQTFFKQNYVVIYKHLGVDKSIVKVEKPQITPVPVNREQASTFFTSITKQTAKPISPVFVNLKEEIAQTEVVPGVQVQAVKNSVNKLANLGYVWSTGELANNKYGLAIDYFTYLGTDKKTNTELKQALYALGVTLEANAGDRKSAITVNGLDENLEPALALVEDWVNHAKADEDVLANLKADIAKSLQDAKLDKGTILRKALNSYARYGAENDFTRQLKPAELEAITSAELLQLIKDLWSTKHRVDYYGPRSVSAVADVIKKVHKVGSNLKDPLPVKVATEQPLDKNQVLFVHYDMVQADMMFIARDVPYDVNLAPVAELYNNYFDGSMGSIVFQELRESKALAYSTFSQYTFSNRKGFSNYSVSGIGTQADKLADAMAGMSQLLNSMPQNVANFENAKKSLKERYESERTSRKDYFYLQEKLEELGLAEDPSKLVYEKLGTLTMADMAAFQKAHIAGKPRTVILIGNRSKIDKATLARYGEVKELTLEQVFGY